MSIIENAISQISLKNIFSAMDNPQEKIIGDAFAKLLEEKLDKISNEKSVSNINSQMGIPAGLKIEPLQGIEFSKSDLEAMNSVAPTNSLKTHTDNNKIEIKDLTQQDYFSTVLEHKNKNLLNFAQKHAGSMYQIFGKNFVGNLTDFANDVKSMS